MNEQELLMMAQERREIEQMLDYERRIDTPLIVTRHAGLVAWLASSRGIVGDVISHASAADVAGRVVYGVLPLHLAAEAVAVVTVDLPDLPADRRGAELSPSEMDEAGATLRAYFVAPMGDASSATAREVRAWGEAHESAVYHAA